MRKKKAFTLIELLIVVAIIAILAAIAVPNFLEAQVRAKVSRLKADMRTIGVAVESYAVGWNVPPRGATAHIQAGAAPNQNWARKMLYPKMTTPIAYITSIPLDIFSRAKDFSGGNVGGTKPMYQYQSARVTMTGAWGTKIPARGFSWALNSLGPAFAKNFTVSAILQGNTAEAAYHVYEPTNGTVSDGQLLRTNKGIYEGQAPVAP